MRPGPVPLKFFRQSFRDQVHGQPGSICRDDGSRLAKLRNAGKQISLDFRIFRYHFDNPIGLGTARQIVFKISDGDFFR